jgi:TPR repeat protein
LHAQTENADTRQAIFWLKMAADQNVQEALALLKGLQMNNATKVALAL